MTDPTGARLHPWGWLTVVMCLATMVWLAARTDRLTDSFPLTGQKRDYYNLLVDGFQDGHLFMKADVHPGRLSPDIEVRRRSPYLMDASEYKGRHYLYFGVVPAVLVFWPYASLTGHDLPEQLAVVLAVGASFLVLLRLYLLARHRCFPGLPKAMDCLNIALLAFATGTPCLARMGGMYEVAISYGCLCAALFWFALFKVWLAPRQLRWWTMASLAYGLGVGCRPTLFLLGPVLPAAALLIWLRHRGQLNLVRLAGAITIPAGCLGLALMLYNDARFDDAFEFGLKYQVNALEGSGKSLHSLAFIPVNIGWYYFSLPALSPYFPYFFPVDTSGAPTEYFGSEPVHGQWLFSLLAGVTLTACALTCLNRERREQFRRDLLPFTALLALGFVVLVLTTSTFGIRSNRYMVDFQMPALLLVVVLGAWTLRTPVRNRVRLGRWAFGLLAMAIVASNILVAIQLLDIMRHTRPGTFGALATLGNRPAAWLTQAGVLPFGPLRFKVRFTRPENPVMTSLVSTGTPEYRDILQAALYPNGYMDFILFHENRGGARSILLPVEWQREYDVELDMGSLYPPAGEAFHAFWRDREPRLLKTFGRVTLDGSEIIRTQQPFHDAPPHTLRLGRSPDHRGSEHTGNVTQVERLPPRDSSDPVLLHESGVWRLELEVPASLSQRNQPLLSAGTTGAGNLLYLQAVSEDEFRFALDCWGVGAASSPPLPRRTGTRLKVDILIGAQAARHFPGALPPPEGPAIETFRRLLCVWVDDRLAWQTEIPAHLDAFDQMELGANTQGFSTASATFSGHLQRQLIPETELRRLLQRWMIEIALPRS